MSDWKCSSCTFWGNQTDTNKLKRTCTKYNNVKSTDSDGCADFCRAIRTMTIAEAIATGIIKKPKNAVSEL